MKELQGLISETNKLLDHAGFEMSVPLGQEGVLYEVSETTFGLPQGIGRIDELRSDYVERKGIGMTVPPIAGLPEVLADTQAAATKIVAIQGKYIDALHDNTPLNARSKKAPYKSRSSEVFQRFSDMAGELMSA